MSPKIFCVGANHRTAGVSEREAFFLSSDSLAKALPAIRARHQLKELLVLSTCNRFELIGVTEGEIPQDPQHSIDAWIDLHAEASSQAKIDRGALARVAYHLHDADAVRHAFRVASSLDSMIPGETQITGQFKEALQLAQTAKTLGPLLARLGQEALATAKKVRSQTNIGAKTVSISHSAVQVAKRMFNDLSECRFLIIGAGEMARVAAEHAASYKPKGLVVANRTQARAYELVQHLGRGDAHGLDNLPHLLANADVVIVATATDGYVVTREMVHKAMKERQAKSSLFLVDIAMPRDVDPECVRYDDVYLFDLDDLKQWVDQNISERHEAASQASVLIDLATDGFGQWLANQSIAPAIARWREHVLATLEREATKTFAKDIFSGMSKEQSAAVQTMLDAASAKLTGDFAQLLRKTQAEQAAILAETLLQFIDGTTTTNQTPKSGEP